MILDIPTIKRNGTATLERFADMNEQRQHEVALSAALANAAAHCDNPEQFERVSAAIIAAIDDNRCPAAES